jgi:TolB-like protein
MQHPPQASPAPGVNGAECKGTGCTCPLCAVPADSVRAQLDRLLQSSNLRNSHRLARLLRFVVENALANPETPPKEYAIGVEVFDRDLDYDPKIDPVGRSEMRRLRFKLTEYYQNGGQTDPVLIDLPKGTYLPRFSRLHTTPPSTASEQSVDDTAAVAHRPRFRRWYLAAAFLLAVATLAALTYRRSFNAKPTTASIAVIPFRDLTPDHSSGPLTQGLTDEIKTSLAQITGIRLIAQVPPESVPKTPGELVSFAEQFTSPISMKGQVRTNLARPLRDNLRLNSTTKLSSSALKTRKPASFTCGEGFTWQLAPDHGFTNRPVCFKRPFASIPATRRPMRGWPTTMPSKSGITW